MQKYSDQTGLLVIGVLLVAIFAIIAPFYGWFIMGAMNSMNETYFEVTPTLENGLPNPLYDANSDKTVLGEVAPWILYMCIGAIFMGLTKAVSMISLTRITETITTNVRQDLYNNIIRKDIGWHDDRGNSAGVMTSTLASDV